MKKWGTVISASFMEKRKKPKIQEQKTKESIGGE
jgi:hypothetical protein